MNSLQTIANQYKMIRQSDGSLYIGNKNTTLANITTDYPAPYGNLFWSSKNQILILASELLQFGLIPGMSIRKIGLEVTSTNGSGPLNNFYIKMKETNATQMMTTFETGLTTVSNKQTYIPIVGLNKHDVSFSWSGGNLIIEFGHFNGSYTINCSTKYTVTANNSVTFVYTDGRSVENDASGFTTSVNRPNIIIDADYIPITKPVISLKADNKLTYTDEAINLMPITITSGPVTSYTLTGTLPPGVSFNTSTGIISGRSQSNTTSTLLITANNYNVFSDPVSFTLVFDESNPIVYIGNFNTTLSNSSESYPAPYGNFFGSSKHQILILASELLQSGMTVGKTINLIGLEVISTNGSQPLNNFYIKMKETSATQMTTTFETGLTTVLNKQTYTPIVGINAHTISTFNWSGGNLIIEFGHFNDSYTYNCSTKYTRTANKSVTIACSDEISVENDASGFTTTVVRPNIIIK